MTSPPVSVIIPCYNQARYLPQAIESVRRQTCQPLELLVVDDGSTDDTADVAVHLGAQVLGQPNRGVSEARNAGLAVATGQFVVMLDADDELLPEAIARGVDALSSRPDLSAVVGRCQLMDAAGNPLPATYHRIDGANLYREWLSKNFVWTPGAAMFRREALIRAGGFPAGLGGAADYAVYLRLARDGAIAYHGQDVVRYRRHDQSMSRNPASMLRLTLKVLARERRAAPRTLRADIDRGRRAWCTYYGDDIVARLSADWHAGRHGLAQLGSGMTLLWHCPRVALGHGRRKLRRILTARAGGGTTKSVSTATPPRRRIPR